MATVTKGMTFGATETVTNTKLHTLVDSATVTNIVNADISASAAIDASKLDLSSGGYLTTGTSAPTLTGNWTFTGNTKTGNFISSLASISTASISTASIGTLNATNAVIASLASIGQIEVETLKIGTTNQGDILYDNGTSITRLTPGTDGQFLKTQGASANPVWATNIAINYSNVIFQWNGRDINGANDCNLFINVEDLKVDVGAEPNSQYAYYGCDSSTYNTILVGKWTKIAGVSTITINSRLWAQGTSGTAEAILNVIVGTASNTVKSVTSSTPSWVTPATIDVSGLTNGTTYDITIQLKNETNGTDAYCSAVVLMGS